MHANRIGWNVYFGTFHTKFHDGVDLNSVLGCCWPVEYNLWTMCEFHKATTPRFFCGIIWIPIHHIKQRWRISQLGISVQVIFKVFAQISTATDECLVRPTVKFIHLLVVSNEPTVGSIIFDEPEVWKILHNVGIAVGAPLFIRTTNPVYSYFVLNIRGVMQRLGHII